MDWQGAQSQRPGGPGDVKTASLGLPSSFTSSWIFLVLLAFLLALGSMARHQAILVVVSHRLLSRNVTTIKTSKTSPKTKQLSQQRTLKTM